jgi:hypothetical protein
MGPRISDVFLDESGASTSTGLLFDMGSPPGSFELKHKTSGGFLPVVIMVFHLVASTFSLRGQRKGMKRKAARMSWPQKKTWGSPN